MTVSSTSSELKKEILRLLKEDEEFRYTVAGLIGLTEVLKRMDRFEEELVKLREDMNKLREDMNKLREDMNKLREDMNKLREDMNKLREEMYAGFDLLNRKITALGARWGVDAESAFREAIRGLLGKELGFSVERWVVQDVEGLVYGYPSQVEVDVAVTDSKTVLIEVTSHVRQADPQTFIRKARLFEELTGRKPTSLLFVSPFVDEKAQEACKALGIQVYTKL
ncbi:hypothetical protein B9Q03_05860 [Candidatus Marsarchaeota G2 archaeon OSP_D]|jgi:Uncharacterized conserved protein containing a coiled-coil domain|uniref:DUF3782 domain-containing protein n=4 Tax=Candidatus Marsarchaeota group 2 TaxID=2203771 RepID=A0A2R6B629_9ARCH|nr:MAG: hypothetical protein B9Q03_05860 [Candidatus Marsarchaeota G2 archaeon OSP_D]PSN94119.1 MAG: hypothetical protein B9Q06_10235 [Candidatus Marsarchaeota G2 archaeon ECH_B_2]PSO00375.1 MAG: hypothetical protein B9Q05_10555 [Candidatus Marsarchaeota G2 archaeon ECH_B_1]